MKNFNIKKYTNPNNGLVFWVVRYPSKTCPTYSYEKVFSNDGMRSFIAHQDELKLAIEKWEMRG
jgi:hypothetical protein